jgi:hypothetical protein
MWIYTPNVNSNPFNCKDTTPNIAVNIEIFDVSQECFSHVQSWYVLPQTPPHRIHDEHGIIRVFYPSTCSIWEFESCLEGGGVALAMELKTLNLNV